MSRRDYKVFSEGKIANLVLKNRLVRSATGTNKMTVEGKTTDELLKIYRDLAAGGVGMIISGVMAVAPGGKRTPKQACIYEDRFIEEIAKIAHAVHQTDAQCAVIAQINHAGRQLLHDNDFAECVGPSAVASPILTKKARELSIQEIEEIIQCFVSAIARVKKAAFDGVQLHAAHGYLLSSFLSPYTNKRNDRYGGSVQNCVSIIREIVSEARKEVGNFPILIKVNCDDHVEGGITKDTFQELLSEIEKTDVDAVEVSGGMWDCMVRSEEELGFFPFPIPESRTRINTLEKQSYYYNDIKDIHMNLPLILVGGHRNIEHMESLLKNENVQYLALCRPLISEADLPKRWLENKGHETTDCVSCNACLLILKDDFGCALKKMGIKKEMFEDKAAESWRSMFK